MSKILKQEMNHLVGSLDRIIVEQCGPKLFAQLNEIRKWSRQARHGGNENSRRRKHSLLDRMPVADAYTMAHAFSLFFQLINLCEERARERHLQSKKSPVMSLRHLFQELKKAGVTSDKLQACLDEMEIQPVLTAHPTEAKRRSVLNQLWRLTQEWEKPEDHPWLLLVQWHPERMPDQENPFSTGVRKAFLAACDSAKG